MVFHEYFVDSALVDVDALRSRPTHIARPFWFSPRRIGQLPLIGSVRVAFLMQSPESRDSSFEIISVCSFFQASVSRTSLNRDMGLTTHWMVTDSFESMYDNMLYYCTRTQALILVAL